MVIGDRLKTLREAKDLSQGDIEQRTGLLRCYVSRAENGHDGEAILFQSRLKPLAVLASLKFTFTKPREKY